MIIFFREVISNIKTNKGIFLITVGTITVSMAILGIFLLLFTNLKNLTEGLGDNLSMIVYLEDNISQKNITRMKKLLKNKKEIESLEFISKEKALSLFTDSLGKDKIILDALDNNPLPASFKIRIHSNYSQVENMDLIVKSLKSETDVESIEYGKEWVEKFEAVITITKLIITTVGVLLYVGFMFIISNTIKLSLYSNSKKIEIMKLVGATDWHIKIPFILEGMIQGLLGSIFSIAILLFAYRVILFKISSLEVQTGLFGSVLFIPPQSILALIVSAVFIGSLGSFISLQKFLNEN